MGDSVCTNRAVQKGTEAIIKIEQADEIKEADSDNEKVLLIGFLIRNTLEEASKWITYEKAEYQFDLVSRCSDDAGDILKC